MGCHTWCYAHFPEKEKAWEEELIECLKNDSMEMIDVWQKMDISELEKYASQENKQNKQWLEGYHEAKDKGDISVYLKYFKDETQMKEYVKNAEKTVTAEEIRTFHLEQFNALLRECEKFNGDLIEFINLCDDKGLDRYSSKYGLYYIKDRKIYRETCHYYGPSFHENPLFEKQFHDMFRIHDYNAKPCYSLEETLERCREYNVEWNKAEEGSDYIENNLDKVKEFWNSYTDAIIEFG